MARASLGPQGPSELTQLNETALYEASMTSLRKENQNNNRRVHVRWQRSFSLGFLLGAQLRLVVSLCTSTHLPFRSLLTPLSLILRTNAAKCSSRSDSCCRSQCGRG